MATLYGTAAHYAENRDFQPRFQNHYEFVIFGLQEALSNSVITGKERYLQAIEETKAVTGQDDLGDIIRLTVSSVTTPDRSIGVSELHHAVDYKKFANGKETIGDLSFSINETSGVSGMFVMYAWYCLCVDPVLRLSGLAVDYKKTTRLYSFNPDGTRHQCIEMYGTFCTNAPSVSFDYTGGEGISLDYTCAVDNWDLIVDDTTVMPNYQPGLIAF